MDIKILVSSGSEQILQSLFSNSGSGCRCMSTSDFTEDILRHAGMFKPDIFVSFFDCYDYNNVQRFYMLKKKPELAGVPFAMIGPQSVCDELKKYAPDLFDALYPSTTPASDLQQMITQAVSARRAMSDAQPPEKKHILVVDDDKNVLRLLKTALEEKNYQITAMANGKMAEKFLETKSADLILLDYQMPNISGAEVFRHIRADKRLADVPVIFLTGVSDSDRVQEVIAMKPQGYLLKPINMERLFIMIRSLLG